jgi:hypothetical protein
VITYFRASTRNYAILRAEAKKVGVTTGFKRANSTRFTSVHMAVQSVRPFERVVSVEGVLDKLDLPEKFSSLLRNRHFWAKVEAVDRVLTPLSKVVMASQADESTLADLTRYWLFLAKSLTDLLTDPNFDAPSEYKSHIVAVYNRRVVKLDLPYSRLALFLDPATKAACLNIDGLSEADNFTALKKLVRGIAFVFIYLTLCLTCTTFPSFTL